MSDRATSFGPTEMYLLDEWGRQLTDAFGSTPYLVGSSARGKRTYRDVDIRMPDALEVTDLQRRVLNVAITLWGRQVTGLPIDFQFQQPEEFSSYDSEVRNPMGPRSKAGWRLSGALAHRRAEKE